jgi:hypothetical protein
MKRRHDNREQVETAHALQPTAGKKGGEVPREGHGPSVREKQEEGGKSKHKRKSD